MFQKILLPLTLFALGLACLSIDYHAGHAYQTFVFNSDGLYLPTLFEDLFAHGGRWSDWYLTPAPYLFPDMPMFMLAYLGGPSAYQQILLFGILQLCLIGVATAYIARTVTRSNAILAGALSTLVLMLLALTAREPFAELLTSGYHAGAFLSALACVALWLNLQDPDRHWSVWARRCGVACLALLAFLTSLSDNLFLVQALLPLAVTAVLLDAPAGAKTWRRLSLPALVLLAGLLGSVSYKHVVSHNTRYPASFGLSHIGQNLAGLRDLAAGEMQALPAFFLLFAAVTVSSLLLIGARLRGRATELQPALVWLTLFSALSVGATLLALLLMTELQVAPRYLISAACLPVILATLALSQYLGKFFVHAGLAAALGVVAILSLHAQQASAARPGGAYYTDEVACIDAALGAEPALRYGIAQYWDAKSIQAFSKRPIVLAQYMPKLQEQRWITSSKYFRERYDFAIISTDPALAEGLSRTSLAQLNGAPRKSVVCGTRTLQIYGAEQLIVLGSAERNWTKAWTGCDLPSVISKADTSCILRKAEPQQEGCLSYGPYEPLAPGRYAVEFDYTSSEAPGADAGEWEAKIALPRSSRTLAKGKIPGSANLSATLRAEFTIQPGQTETVEVTSFSNKGGTMAVSALRFRRLD